jgi:hypothetical protein
VAGGGSIGVTITNIEITDSTFANVLSGDTAVDSSGGFLKVTGSGFKNNAKVFFNNAVIANTFISSSQINANVPATISGNYTFYVVNSDGVGAFYPSSIRVSGPPSWSSTSYSSANLTLGIQLLATGDAPLTYYIKDGSANPENLSVNSTGYLSGTVSAEGAYTLTVIVDDAEFQSTQADITITVQLVDPYFKNTVFLLPGSGTNNANNNTFQDSSASNVTVTRVGNPTQGSFSPFSQTGWSYYYDGNGDWANIASQAGLALGSGDFTWECYFYTALSSLPTNATLYDQRNGTNGAAVVQPAIELTSANGYTWYVRAANKITSGTSAVKLHTWQHLAICRSSGITRMFVEGQQVGSDFADTENYPAGSITIARANDGVNTRYYTGYTADLRVVIGTALYTSNFTPPTTPLTAITNTALLIGRSNRFVDNSSNNFALTINGDVSVQPFGPYAPTTTYSTANIGGSGYFDGTGDSLTASPSTGLSFGTGDYTIEAYAYASVVSDGRCVFYTRPASAYTHILRYAGTTFWELYYPGGSTSITLTSANNAKGQWTHHALVRRSGILYWYINGTQVFSVANTTNVTDTYIEVGNYASYYWNGFVSSLRVVKGTAVYTGNFTPPTAPLTAISGTEYLLNFTNAGIYDATARIVTETVGNAKISTVVSKWGTGALVFDGTGDGLTIPTSPLLELGTGDFTIEAYINPSSQVNTYGTIFGAAAAGGLILTLRGSGTASSISMNPYGSADIFNYSYTFTTGTWYHIAVSRSGTSLRVFIEGIQLSSTVTNSTSWGAIRVIGGIDSGATQNYTGYMNDVRVTKGYARYTANFTPPGGPSLLL